MKYLASVLTFTCICFLGTVPSDAQSGGTIEGVVSLPTGDPAHRASVMIVQLAQVVETGEEGRFRFDDVQEGSYDLVAYLSPLASETYTVEVPSVEGRSVNIRLRVSPLKQEITVTARGREQLSFEAVQSVTTLDSFDLAESMATSLGDVLDGELGVAKRSFGTGSARPVLRGFDGDRVLVMEDGMRVGSLASQSGDHGEPIDTSNVERIEVVKGPATLLYGSNAVGGVINAVSSHQEIDHQPHQGLRGQLSSSFGSANEQAGGSFNAEYGFGPWLMWFGGGGQRTDDYDTPAGRIENSRSRISNGSAGFGWYGQKMFASVGYKGNDGRYGIPFAQDFHAEEEGEEGAGHAGEEVERVNVAFRRHRVQFTGGLRELDSAIDGFRLSLSYTDWNHDEVETLRGDEQVVGTTFENQQLAYRAVFEQSASGALGGTFGFEGVRRDYDTAGEEALSPAVDQNSFAFFALEELDVEGLKVQFGGRVERTTYEPRGPIERSLGHGAGSVGSALVHLPDQDFTGFSGGIGALIELWSGGALVANYTNSYRAPALEELYNFGPHVGNLTFEIGNSDLGRERSNGFDFSLRQRGDRFRGEANFYYYDIDDFVFLAPTGEIEDGLVEAEFRQGDSRFVGAELKADIGVHENLWLNVSLDTVKAELREMDRPLPRIPPLRASVGLDVRYGNFSFKPELIMADSRRDVFDTETATAGYALVNLKASYTIPQQHFAHHLAVNFFNVGDTLYRNHLSFIKDLAPEIGRGVRFSYTVKFF